MEQSTSECANFLLDLPHELQEMIWVYVPLKETIRNLNLVCKSWRSYYLGGELDSFWGTLFRT